MSNTGKILGFGAIGLALLTASKNKASKTAVKDVAPLAFSANGSDIDSLVNTIKNNGSIRTLLKGEKGDKGDVGDNGAGVLPAGLVKTTNSFLNVQTDPSSVVTTGVNLINGKRLIREVWADGSKETTYYYDGTGYTPIFEINCVTGGIAKIGGGSFSALSDERLKQNIEPFKSGLDKVLAIETKIFNYKKVEGTQTQFYPDSLIQKKQYGVIAQELKEVCPEMVMMGDDGYLTVDLSNLSLILVNAVKELNKKDIDQQKIITSQSSKIKALEEQQSLILERLIPLETK